MAEVPKIVTAEVLDMSRWGVESVPASYDMRQHNSVDFQDMMVFIAEQHAQALELEVPPLSKRIEKRNTELSQLGKALACCNELQAKYDTKETNPSSQWGKIDAEAAAGFALCGLPVPSEGGWDRKATCDKYTQELKTQIDKRNNESQQDMTQLQGVVDKRDQSYTAASTLMTSVSDSIGGLIGNFC